MDDVPTKETIQASFHGASTKCTYATYQRQFETFFGTANPNKDPSQATTHDCTDFLHHLLRAKTAFVSYFKQRKIDPNPAQAVETKQYVVGLQKYNSQHNIDDEKKAHPLTVHKISLLVNSLAQLNTFMAAMLRFLLCACYLGCFRISEMLALKWSDVDLGDSPGGHFVSVHLRWHKKASVEKECQVYNLVDEQAYPCLRVCGFYDEYVNSVRATLMNVTKDSFVFPQVICLNGGSVKVNWAKAMEQKILRKQIYDIVESTPSLSVNISLHSIRRGGCFYRVFESPERKFNFRELMAWCRWEDTKTCCEYLVTKSLSDAIDPRRPLQTRHRGPHGVDVDPTNVTATANQIAQYIHVVSNLQGERTISLPTPSSAISSKQSSIANKPAQLAQRSMQDFVVPKIVPTARSAKDAWEQWFSGHAPLKDYTKSMIKSDRKKYSERQTIATAFTKYQTYSHFEQAYAGYTETYSNLLHEVRKRKRENRL
ncbi:Aste57867_2333 [Aphanomyces stellatus]|uniref:Aste57867_2333 protein n=1 Tax=Aphanomyces stellatus TaxID=120398 RepID=A0A485KB24_9STRA|nr:hypothetical protein As57867_002328 [Aphanomyces stellatus]VFT79535.1 Aste57867_2333 [Aphanomyces stellatus]